MSALRSSQDLTELPSEKNMLTTFAVIAVGIGVAWLLLRNPAEKESSSVAHPRDEHGPFLVEPHASVKREFERDEVLADLNRRATDAKEAKDWPTAVALLQQAKEHEGRLYQDTRLAMYLQQAGRFDEAMAEFDWLLSMAPEQCDSSAVPMSAAFRSFSIARMNALIHNKIRIAASREKRADLVSQHQLLHEQYETEVEKLKPAVERQWKKERLAYAATEAKLEKKRQTRASGN